MSHAICGCAFQECVPGCVRAFHGVRSVGCAKDSGSGLDLARRPGPGPPAPPQPGRPADDDDSDFDMLADLEPKRARGGEPRSRPQQRQRQPQPAHGGGGDGNDGEDRGNFVDVLAAATAAALDDIDGDIEAITAEFDPLVELHATMGEARDDEPGSSGGERQESQESGGEPSRKRVCRTGLFACPRFGRFGFAGFRLFFRLGIGSVRSRPPYLDDVVDAPCPRPPISVPDSEPARKLEKLCRMHQKPSRGRWLHRPSTRSPTTQTA